MLKKGQQKSQQKFMYCPCVGATLDKMIQPAILAILTEGPLHGYELGQKIGDIPHLFEEPPDLSGTYRILKSFEKRGMVTSSWNITQGGHPKRIFAITESGRQCLQHWLDTLQNYRKGIGSLLKTVQKAVQ